MLNELYFFKYWKEYVNWCFFFITGGAALRCLICKTDEEMAKYGENDIDVFAAGITFKQFKYEVREFIHQLENNYVVKIQTKVGDGKEYKIRIFWLKKNYMFANRRWWQIIGKTLINFVFIAPKITPAAILSTFDLEIVKVMYNVKMKKIFVSLSWIESMETQSTISYKLSNSVYNLMEFMPRLKKYMDRGFSLLIPEDLKLAKFYDALNNYKIMINITDHDFKPFWKYFDMRWNCDVFNRKKKFIDLFGVDATKELKKTLIYKIKNKKYKPRKTSYKHINDNPISGCDYIEEERCEKTKTVRNEN